MVTCPKCSHNSLEVTQNGIRFRTVCTREECGFQSQFVVGSDPDPERVKQFLAVKEATAKIWGRHVEEADEYATYHGVLDTIARARAQEELSSGTTVFFSLTDPQNPAVFQYGQGELLKLEWVETGTVAFISPMIEKIRKESYSTRLVAVISLPDGSGEETRPFMEVFTRAELSLEWAEWRLLKLIEEVSQRWPAEEVQSIWSWSQVISEFQLYLMAEDKQSPLWMLSQEEMQTRLTSLQARGLLDREFRLTYQAYFALRVGFVADTPFAAESAEEE